MEIEPDLDGRVGFSQVKMGMGAGEKVEHPRQSRYHEPKGGDKTN